MSVAALETLVAGAATRHFVAKPAALESQDKEFSLADLAKFDTIDDAREASIARRVEDVMRGSLDDWVRWFAGRVGDAARSLAHDPDRLNEVVQRRHVIVHNSGRVSRLYKANTGSKELVGTQLVTDRAYLDQAFAELEIFGTRLATLAWIKWEDPPEATVATFLNARVYALLEAERWSVARCLAATAQRLKPTEQLRQFLRVNEWQAIKRDEGVDAIRAAVEEWDTSALSAEFEVARAALLDDYDKLRKALPRAVERGVISRHAVEEWPLFREARNQAVWREIINALPADKNSEATRNQRPGRSRDLLGPAPLDDEPAPPGAGDE